MNNARKGLRRAGLAIMCLIGLVVVLYLAGAFPQNENEPDQPGTSESESPGQNDTEDIYRRDNDVAFDVTLSQPRIIPTKDQIQEGSEAGEVNNSQTDSRSIRLSARIIGTAAGLFERESGNYDLLFSIRGDFGERPLKLESADPGESEQGLLQLELNFVGNYRKGASCSILCSSPIVFCSWIDSPEITAGNSPVSRQVHLLLAPSVELVLLDADSGAPIEQAARVSFAQPTPKNIGSKPGVIFSNTPMLQVEGGLVRQSHNVVPKAGLIGPFVFHPTMASQSLSCRVQCQGYLVLGVDVVVPPASLNIRVTAEMTRGEPVSTVKIEVPVKVLHDATGAPLPGVSIFPSNLASAPVALRNTARSNDAPQEVRSYVTDEAGSTVIEYEVVEGSDTQVARTQPYHIELAEMAPKVVTFSLSGEEQVVRLVESQAQLEVTAVDDGERPIANVQLVLKTQATERAPSPSTIARSVTDSFGVARLAAVPQETPLRLGIEAKGVFFPFKIFLVDPIQAGQTRAVKVTGFPLPTISVVRQSSRDYSVCALLLLGEDSSHLPAINFAMRQYKLERESAAARFERFYSGDLLDGLLLRYNPGELVHTTALLPGRYLVLAWANDTHANEFPDVLIRTISTSETQNLEVFLNNDSTSSVRVGGAAVLNDGTSDVRRRVPAALLLPQELSPDVAQRLIAASNRFNSMLERAQKRRSIPSSEAHGLLADKTVLNHIDSEIEEALTQFSRVNAAYPLISRSEKGYSATLRLNAQEPISFAQWHRLYGYYAESLEISENTDSVEPVQMNLAALGARIDLARPWPGAIAYLEHMPTPDGFSSGYEQYSLTLTKSDGSINQIIPPLPRGLFRGHYGVWKQLNTRVTSKNTAVTGDWRFANEGTLLKVESSSAVASLIVSN